MCGKRRGPMRWVDPPPKGTPVCGGFDGATTSDWTVIKLETVDGLLFTPRYGRDERPAIWNPEQWGGRVPRGEVHAAWEQIADMYELERVYCDPWHFQSEIASWGQAYGEKVFIEWHTNREKPMHEALETFYTDISSRVLRHDGCPLTTLAMGNARRVTKPGARYGLAKPSDTQKIDAVVTSVLAHKAAVDARATGWGGEQVDTRVFCFGNESRVQAAPRRDRFGQRRGGGVRGW